MCQAGASWVRTNILRKYPSAQLSVFAIWTNKLFFDSRRQWDGGGLTDPRVMHLWDDRDISGKWLINDLPGFNGGDWDAFALFGPDATWGPGKPPVVGASGSTIIGSSQDLAAAFNRMLAAK